MVEDVRASPKRAVHTNAAATHTDVGRLMDFGPWTSAHLLIVVLAASAIVLDGFDGQLIGFAIPDMMRDWGIPRSAFVPVVAAGLCGMGFGSLAVGMVADRYGRRTAIIGSVLIFGAATCLIGLAQNITMLTGLRFLAGLGVGGALPSAATMAAECTPLRHRTVAVTATIVCVPVGGMLAGLFANLVLAPLGWRGLFIIGGATPLALSLVLLALLPESARFLVRHPARWPELRALLARLSQPAPPHTVFIDAAEAPKDIHTGIGALFNGGRARETTLIALSFFLCLMAVYTAFSWLPSMLTAEGLSVRSANIGLTVYNFGGVIGAVTCAWLTKRMGSRWPLAVCCAGGALSALALSSTPVASPAFIIGLGAHGLFVNAVQSTLYAVCAYIYPTRIRATGTAFGISIGRLGAILSAFAGAMVITHAGARGFLDLLAGAMAGVFFSLLLLRQHIPPTRLQNPRPDIP